MPVPRLRLTGIDKSFGATHALRNVSIEVAPGEAHALIGKPRILIMDEPTSSLTRSDVESLFAVIGRLREAGVSIIYISHFLEECQRICDRYTVLRDGQTVGSGGIASTTIPELVK